jgi:hypothetical protein
MAETNQIERTAEFPLPVERGWQAEFADLLAYLAEER